MENIGISSNSFTFYVLFSLKGGLHMRIVELSEAKTTIKVEQLHQAAT